MPLKPVSVYKQLKNFMKKYLIPFSIIFAITSCIPPGKLTESLEANTKLNSKYDSLKNKLNDTLSTFSTSLNSLKSNINNLKDSVSYYRGLVVANPLQSQGDAFLNQMFSNSLLSTSELAGFKTANSSQGLTNTWLESFKTDLKKYAVADVEVKLNKGFVLVDIPSNIMFASGSASLNSKSIEMLGGIALLLNAQPEVNFLIEGHTDNKTFKENKTNDNWTLSVNRAAAVAKIFQNKFKIDPKRMIAAGRSQYLPVADNNTKEGRLNNRRIRIILMPSVKQLMNLNN
jgi:chemotaxis protein MotB